MKIAIIHRYYPLPGGVTSAVEALKKEFRGKVDFEIITAQKIEEPNIISLPSKSATGFYFKAMRYLQKNKFDIVHSFSSFVPFFKWMLKSPVILSVQGYETVYDWISLRNFLKYYSIAKLKVLSYIFADKLIVPSKFTKKEIISKYSIAEDKIQVIYNAISVDMFQPMKLKKKDSIVRIFQYSTANRKGFQYVLKWVEKLSKKIKNFKIVLVAGDAKAIPDNLKDYFEVRGAIKFKDMPTVYNQCDIVILPSIYDPYGMTASEGMACGKPAIVSKFAGASEFVKNGVNGFVCDFEDFPQKLELLIKNSKLREKMGRDARKIIAVELSSKTIAQNHLKFYEKIVNI